VDIKLNKKIKKEANEVLKNKDLGLDDNARIEKEKKRKKNKKQKERKKKKWYKARLNTSVYIDGLPKDIKREEIKEMFSRCGVIRLDPVTSEDRIKIYKDEEGKNKGDGLVTFVNLESVDLALDIMDGREIRKGFPVKVKVAEFKQKGEYRERKVVKIDEIAKIKYKGRIIDSFNFSKSGENVFLERRRDGRRTTNRNYQEHVQY
jgi:HIV Tat-specific factor 1